MANSERFILVLQGGGALGAYQAGAFQALAAGSFAIEWVAGISIGAINAAIICGNPPQTRLKNLGAFWEGVTSALAMAPWLQSAQSRQVYGKFAATEVMAFGVPGFFRPRLPLALWYPEQEALSVYDTAPLEKTLGELVDFDYLNEAGPRLSVGAVEIESGNFVYFDSRKQRIEPRHIMASGALPPGFPPIEIDRQLYWDGGLVSNTPLQYVMENLGKDPACIFQIDLFDARGKAPRNLSDVQQREKDIRYSSRTRLTTDRYRHLHAIRAAAERLAGRLPAELQSDPDLAYLRTVGPAGPVTLVHLIHRKAGSESNAKDYEFSRLSMIEHWAAGVSDVGRTLAHKAWKSRVIGEDRLQVFDIGSRKHKDGDDESQ